MAIRVECDGCGSAFRVNEDRAGKKGKCPKCGGPITVPEPVDGGVTPAESEADVDATGKSIGEIRSAGSRTSRSARSDDEPSRLEPREVHEPQGFSGVALGAAAGAAVLGAALWAVISIVTEYEIGFVAWGIGGLVGFAAIKAGGGGAQLALAGALLSIVSIFAGKAIALKIVIDRDIDAFLEESLSHDFYAESRSDARDLVALGYPPDEDALRRYLVSHRFVDTNDPATIDADYLREFQLREAPFLRRLHEDELDFEAWQAASMKRARSNIDVSLMDELMNSLQPLDLLFVVLGVTTAWGMINRAGGPRPGSAIARSRARRR